MTQILCVNNHTMEYILNSINFFVAVLEILSFTCRSSFARLINSGIHVYVYIPGYILIWAMGKKMCEIYYPNSFK